MPIKRTSKYQLSQWEKTDQVLMEDFNTDNLNIENALAGLETSKAKQTDLTALSNTVNTKANQSDLTALSNTVNTKANQSDLTALSNTVKTKANQSDLTALSNTVNTKANKSDLDSLKTEVAAKATSAALTSLQNTVTQLSNTLTTTQSTIPKIKAGYYTGDGQANKTINVGFTPKAVLVVNHYGQMYILQGGAYNSHYGGLAVTGSASYSSTQYSNQRPVTLEITTNGFIVHYTTVSGSANANSYTNVANSVYHYIAFG